MISLYLAALTALPLVAQDAPQQGAQPQQTAQQTQTAPDAQQGAPTRIRSILLYGDDTCPAPSSPDEIVVCARGGDSPFRIPEALREHEQTPANTSWVRRVEIIEEVNRVGLPDSCSPVGTGGQTGCTRQMLQQWAQERIDAESRQSLIP